MLLRSNYFYDMLVNISRNVNHAAQYFYEFKIESAADVPAFAEKMKEYEDKGDQYTHELIKQLNTTSRTPLKREDILQLASKMDDVVDGLEACAMRFYMYNLTSVDKYMEQFARNIYLSTNEMTKAVEKLRQEKFMQIREFTIKINELETEADDLLRTSVKELFTKSTDAIAIIKYKEIYETLERISDSCEDVANTLETIIMKNS
ncbi:DUF47 domain-containing protein [Bacillaceae bacterium]